MALLCGRRSANACLWKRSQCLGSLSAGSTWQQRMVPAASTRHCTTSGLCNIELNRFSIFGGMPAQLVLLAQALQGIAPLQVRTPISAVAIDSACRTRSPWIAECICVCAPPHRLPFHACSADPPVGCTPLQLPQPRPGRHCAPPALAAHTTPVTPCCFPASPRCRSFPNPAKADTLHRRQAVAGTINRPAELPILCSSLSQLPQPREGRHCAPPASGGGQRSLPGRLVQRGGAQRCRRVQPADGGGLGALPGWMGRQVGCATLAEQPSAAWIVGLVLHTHVAALTPPCALLPLSSLHRCWTATLSTCSPAAPSLAARRCWTGSLLR